MFIRSKITTLREWDEILHNVSSMGVQDNRTIEEVYKKIIYKQYSLHLLDYNQVDKRIKYQSIYRKLKEYN